MGAVQKRQGFGGVTFHGSKKGAFCQIVEVQARWGGFVLFGFDRFLS
jgi:hypothetical protein